MNILDHGYCYLPTILLSVLLHVACPFTAKAVRDLDNSSAEALCFSFIRSFQETTQYREFGPREQRALAARLKRIVVSGGEDVIINQVSRQYSKFRGTYWIWGSERKKVGLPPRKARSIRHVDWSKTASGARFNLIVEVEDDSWAAGEAGYLLTFFLRPEEVGVGPFRRYKWRMADIHIASIED